MFKSVAEQEVLLSLSHILLSNFLEATSIDLNGNKSVEPRPNSCDHQSEKYVR